ncbi:hypothetical protein [Hyphomicrobium sp. DY-1]|uniref:hypothetical protein n=1 Tax=Hyphomicrobium sp. DY-1 TaxID=3075650 RepID=UPI0039C338F0
MTKKFFTVMYDRIYFADHVSVPTNYRWSPVSRLLGNCKQRFPSDLHLSHHHAFGNFKAIFECSDHQVTVTLAQEFPGALLGYRFM